MFTDFDLASKFRQRHDLRGAHILTIGEQRECVWVIDKLRPIIIGQTVIEIGAGLGILAHEMARHAKHVWAIEPDPEFSWRWVNESYQNKPSNLTWIFDRAETMVDILRADVVVMMTGSGADYFRALAEKFSPRRVVMPWQDWHNGNAVVSNASFGQPPIEPILDIRRPKRRKRKDSK